MVKPSLHLPSLFYGLDFLLIPSLILRICNIGIRIPISLQLIKRAFSHENKIASLTFFTESNHLVLTCRLYLSWRIHKSNIWYFLSLLEIYGPLAFTYLIGIETCSIDNKFIYVFIENFILLPPQFSDNSVIV